MIFLCLPKRSEKLLGMVCGGESAELECKCTPCSVTGDITGEQAGCCCHFSVFHHHHPHSASFDSPAAESFLCKKAAAVHAQACKDEAELNSPQSIINSP